MSFLLLVSATIDPRGMPYLALTDVAARRAQYLEGLRRLLLAESPLLDAITFVENSGQDLGPFHEVVRQFNVHGKAVELLGPDLNDYPRDLGKGYGEFRTLDAVVAISRLARSRTHLVKLTGRLGVKNLGAIVAALPPDFDLAADIYPHRPQGVRGVVDTRLIAFDREFYEREVAGLYQEMNDAAGVWAEHALYQLVRRRPEARIVGRLPREPRWVGASATTSEHYGGGLAAALHYPLNVVRRKVHRFLSRPNLARVWATATDTELATAQPKADSDWKPPSQLYDSL